MHSGVHGQRRSLNELLVAAGIIAHMRSNPAVNTFWSFFNEPESLEVERKC